MTTTPNPTAEQIERAAEALAAWDGFEWSGDWEGTVSRDAYRNGATLALSAAARVAPQEPCPQPCEHLSAEDAREGRDCREHPCTCPTSPLFDREKLIEEARAVAGPKSLYAHTSVAHLLIRLADALAAAGVAPQEPSAHANPVATSPGDVKNQTDSFNVAPQEPHGDYHEGLQEGIKIGRTEMKPDPEKVAEVINRLPWGYMVDGPSVDEIARALCEAAKRGELSA